MIEPPAGWEARELADGAIVLESPSVPGIGSFRVERRERSEESFGEISALGRNALATLDEFRYETLGKIEMSVTAEGEYAASVTTKGMTAGLEACAEFGVVIADGCHVVLLGHTTDKTTFEPFAAAARGALSTVRLKRPHRSRPFLYRPPRGWHGVQSGANALWYAPEFPMTAATITVPPADAHDGSGLPEQIYAAIEAIDNTNGFVREKSDGPEPMKSDFGLRGSAWSILGAQPGAGRTCRDVVVLGDQGFVYTVVLTTTTPSIRAKCQPAFAEMIASIQPIPNPSGSD